MIWFIVFFTIMALAVAALICCVPVEHRHRYARCPKDQTYWLVTCLFNAIWVVAAIQFATAPSFPLPIWLRIVGAVMMAAGFALVIWARRCNPFFVPKIVVPEYFVTTGPYARIDHPGYMGLSLAASGGCFLLGQLWAFWPTFAYLCLLARRIHVEERILAANFQR